MSRNAEPPAKNLRENAIREVGLSQAGRCCKALTCSRAACAHEPCAVPHIRTYKQSLVLTLGGIPQHRAQEVPAWH